MSNTRSLKILFFGDLVGKIARNAVANYLDELRQNNNYPDFVIANVENASHGFGLFGIKEKFLTTSIMRTNWFALSITPQIPLELAQEYLTKVITK